MSFTRNNIILLGDCGVGKTSALRQFLENKFDQNERPTDGVSFRTLDYSYDGLQLKIAVWDASSLAKYSAVARLYYRDVSAAVVVYDVTNRLSFESCNTWINTIREHSPIVRHISLVANKVDRRDRYNDKHVTRKEGKELAHRKSVDFIETSAKHNINIGEMFSRTLDGMIRRYVLTPIDVSVFKYKAIMVGDSGVGKSSLMDRLCGQAFNETSGGTHFRTINRNVNHCSVVLEFWDSLSRVDHSLMSLYFRSAHTVILVYDIQSQQSFDNLVNYVNIIYSTCDETTTMPFIVLLGNKRDQSGQRDVRSADVREFVDDHQVIGLCDEVSAKCDQSFDKLLNKICVHLLNIFANIPMNNNLRVRSKSLTKIGKSAKIKNFIKCGSKSIT